MNIYFDFEFEPKSLAPVSFGAISQNGMEFYCEFEFNAKSKSDFFLENVLPLLDGINKIQADDFRSRLIEYFGDLDQCTFVCDYIEDRNILASLIVGGVNVSIYAPTNEYDFSDSYASFFDDHGLDRHHALNDAKALKHAFESTNGGR